MCGIFAVIQAMKLSDAEKAIFTEYFWKTQHRGPDNSKIEYYRGDSVMLGFHRLAINDLTKAGDQPMQHCHYPGVHLICNGEIYNWKELAQRYSFDIHSHSDCEIILHMYATFGIEKAISQLDGYFAFVIFDETKNKVVIGRDVIGVRPLFIAFSDNQIIVSSEFKSIPFKESYSAKQFDSGHYLEVNIDDIIKVNFHSYYDFSKHRLRFVEPSTSAIFKLLDRAVEKRLMSDRPIGAFLSGGVDSCIVVALLAEHYKHFKCFTIALNGEDTDDIKYARKLVQYLNDRHDSDIEHVIVKVSFDEIESAIEPLVTCLETWDTTTIRASVCQYLLSTYISKNTNVKVLYSGEGSDELFAGYKLFRFAPSDQALGDECIRLVQNLPFFDCLRTDRSTAQAGLEVRVPFLDNEFFDYVLHIDPSFKKPGTLCEKHLLREAFKSHLPDDVLWRPKDAFSDSVSTESTNLRVLLKNSATKKLQELRTLDTHIPEEVFSDPAPKSDEEIYYRYLFCTKYHRYLQLNEYWMPPSHWFSYELNDPSATTIIL